MGPNDFSCYYQVYNNPEATRKVLTQFRKYHPDNPIYMVSDGGLDFSDIAKEFNCVYQHSWLNIGYWSHTKPEVIEYRSTGGTRGHCYGWNLEESLVYLHRFEVACSYNRPYVMLLEDDIFINGPIEIKEDFDITYGGFNPFNFKALARNLDWQGTDRFFPNGWGMCGGNFIKTDTFRNAYAQRELFIREYNAIQQCGLEGIGYMDSIMSVLLFCAGLKHTAIMNPIYSESNSGATIYHDRSKRTGG